MPELPEGWVLSTETLTQDFELLPENDDSTFDTISGARKPMGQFACGYTLVWDQFGNNFHRYVTTTGHKNIQLNSILGGRTPSEFKSMMTTILITVVVSLVGIACLIAYCVYCRKSDTGIKKKVD